MKIYIDFEFKCHTADNGTCRAVETDFFANKCDTFIEGHRLKPAGETWIRDDGEIFSGGEMVTPWKPSNALAAAQAQYDTDRAEAEAAYRKGVNSI